MKKTIKVNLKNRSYKIFIQDNLLNDFGGAFKEATRSSKIAILSNARIFKICGWNILNSLKKVGLTPIPIFVFDGEKNKNEISLLHILKKLALNGFQRDSCLIALGGGVIGDLGGLAASIYMRGIDFVQCPTTFLAQVDSSIGGKTAIDFAGTKNLVGTFYQPKVVFTDPCLLKTLSKRQFATGLAEVIKYGVIQDEKMFAFIEANLVSILGRDQEKLFYLISKSCNIKARIVSQDEKENGRRAWLNYGHTLGHALESYYQYQVLTHGEAISFGMWFATLLSFRLGLCSKDILKRQVKLFKRAGLLPVLPRFNPLKIYQKMLLDKKARNERIQFILTRKIGLVTIQKNVQQSIILSALTQLQAEASELS